MSFGRTNKFFNKAMIITLGVIIGLYCVSLLVPIYWMITTSLKNGQLAYLQNPIGLPIPIRFSNYKDTWRQIYVQGVKDGRPGYYWIDALLFNSIFYSVVQPAWSIFLTACCAYTLAKYKNKFTSIIFAVGIFVFLTPTSGYFPAELLMKRALGIWNNRFLYILTSPSAAFSGIIFLALYAVCKAIPWSFAEAVFMDGGGHFTVFWKIMFPLMLPAIISWYILGFLGVWNDTSVALIWLPGYPNLALGMVYFQEMSWLYNATYPMIMAGMVVVIVPAVILFLLTQKLAFKRINVGGIKG